MDTSKQKTNPNVRIYQQDFTNQYNKNSFNL